MKAQFITTPAGEELVILPKAEFEALVNAAEEALEDAADVAAYDAAVADLEGSQRLPELVSAHILKGISPLRAIRLWRDLQQVAVADASGLSQGFLSDLENGKRTLTDDVRPRLPLALDVPEAWLH